jgi:parvulin-like peptidyl-prolyl isomerase
MKRLIISVLLLAPASLFAQNAPASSAAPATPSGKDAVVAVVNGENITRAKLDQLWNRLSSRTRQQYERTGGGKAGFLEYYVKKRILLQKAAASGFDKRADVQAELEAARESALYDYYVREAIAPEIVSNTDLQKFYDANPQQFTYGERRYLRLLLVSTKNRSIDEARGIMMPIAAHLLGDLKASQNSNLPAEAFGAKFSEYARKYSEDTTTAAAGGEIGWYEQSQLDPKIAEGVFSVREGNLTGVLEGDAGLMILFVQSVRPPERESFEDARAGIREFLLGQNTQRILEKVNQTTAALRSAGKVELHPENLH